MKKKNCILLIALFLVGTVYIVAKKENNSVFRFQYATDEVRIELHDSAVTSGYVVPGQIRDINMMVENLASESRIRWKAEIRVNEETKHQLSDELIAVSSNWELHSDGYYYGTAPAGTDEMIPMFEQIEMPIDIIDETEEGDAVSIAVIAEAVQDGNNNVSWNEIKKQDSVEKTLGVE